MRRSTHAGFARYAIAVTVMASALAAMPSASAQNAAAPAAKVAVLQGLDKVTARISTFDAPLDTPVRFGTLEITARYCSKRPPEEPPETTVFLEIRDLRRDQPPETVFTGWMFASSPAVSALEHPVYDVWVIDCKTSSPETPEAGKE